MCMPPAPGIFSFSSSYSPPQFPSPPRSSLSLFFLLPCLGRGPPTFALSLRLSTLLPFAAGFRRSLQSMRGYTGCYRNTRPNFRMLTFDRSLSAPRSFDLPPFRIRSGYTYIRTWKMESGRMLEVNSYVS